MTEFDICGSEGADVGQGGRDCTKCFSASVL